MTVIRPDWFSADKPGPAASGPEQYAPPDRRPPKKLNDDDHIALLRRQRDDADSTSDPAREDLNALIQRVAGASMDEIDRVIRDLESVRDMLRKEGERVSREVVGYATLSQLLMTAMKVIADSLEPWKAREKSD